MNHFYFVVLFLLAISGIHISPSLVVIHVKIFGSYLIGLTSANPDAKRLYDDLLSNYNKLVRPVVNVTDAVTVRLKLKLSQLIDVVSVVSTLLSTSIIRKLLVWLQSLSFA